MLAPGISDFAIDHLPLLQRILVTTDGTVTDMLSVAFLEPIELAKISVTLAPSAERVAVLDLPAGSMTMLRQIVLRGSRSRRPYAYAETIIAADRLPGPLRDDLLAGVVPLGQLWQAHRLETWKERPVVRERPAGSIATHLDVTAEVHVIERAYRTFTTGVPVFHVREYFPASYEERP
jgi:chorismate-pyruvate lyase